MRHEFSSHNTTVIAPIYPYSIYYLGNFRLS